MSLRLADWIPLLARLSMMEVLFIDLASYFLIGSCWCPLWRSRALVVPTSHPKLPVRSANSVLLSIWVLLGPLGRFRFYACSATSLLTTASAMNAARGFFALLLLPSGIADYWSLLSICLSSGCCCTKSTEAIARFRLATFLLANC